MNEEDEFSPFGGFGSGCDIHGEEYLRECTMCGIEFCSACFPQSTLCSDCAAQGALDDEEEDDVPTAEDKDLLLLEGFNDDEPEEDAADPASVPAPAIHAKVPAAPRKPARKTLSKPAQAAPKARKAQPARKAARPASKAKPRKPALRAARAKPKAAARKPAKAAPKKAKAKARKKR